MRRRVARDAAVERSDRLAVAPRRALEDRPAARRGAAGVILIHTDASATYPWSVVENSNGGERFQLTGTGQPQNGIQGWITNGSAERIFKAAGQDLDALRAKAETEKRSVNADEQKRLDALDGEMTFQERALDNYVKVNRIPPEYRQFFPFAFFFTIMHVVALVVTTVPAGHLWAHCGRPYPGSGSAS